MHTGDCWIIENYEYKRCRAPRREFRSVASLHNHSIHSLEDLAALNRVVAMPVMRRFKGILQSAFGLTHVPNLNYADVHYNPPLTPAQVLSLELASARQIGFDSVIFSLMDHNTISGALELLDSPSFDPNRIGLGEELSVLFNEHIFHLGLVGLPADRLTDVHKQLQTASQSGHLDELFELLNSMECLVILNHPLLPWNGGSIRPEPTVAFLERFGWAIHALEYNGMRSQTENDSVLSLARQVGKPLAGGGDSHLLTASSALCVSREAESVAEYIREVKEGKAITLVRNDYHAPLRWKLFLRVLYFIAQYRRIARYKESEIESVIGKDRLILLDPVGGLARIFLRLTAALKLVR